MFVCYIVVVVVDKCAISCFVGFGLVANGLCVANGFGVVHINFADVVHINLTITTATTTDHTPLHLPIQEPHLLCMKQPKTPIHTQMNLFMILL